MNVWVAQWFLIIILICSLLWWEVLYQQSSFKQNYSAFFIKFVNLMVGGVFQSNLSPPPPPLISFNNKLQCNTSAAQSCAYPATQKQAPLISVGLVPNLTCLDLTRYMLMGPILCMLSWEQAQILKHILICLCQFYLCCLTFS